MAAGQSRPGWCSRCSGQVTSTPRTALCAAGLRRRHPSWGGLVARRLRGPPRGRRVVAGPGEDRGDLLGEAVVALRGNDVGMLGWAIDNLRAAAALAGVPESPHR